MNRTLAFGIFGLVLASGALAQESTQTGISVRGGLFFPSSSAGQDVGRTWFGGGLEYRLQNVNVGKYGASEKSGDISLSVDYIGKEDASAVPIMLNYVSHKNELYYTVGAGISMNRVPNGAGSSDDSTKVGFTAGIGYNFQQGRSPLFVEGRYWGNSSATLNGFAAYIGVRL
jgi:hypothetical protein